jgi:hypothetical protein
VSCHLHAPAALLPGKEPRYPLDRRLGGPQNLFGQEKSDPSSVQTVASRYTDWAIRAPVTDKICAATGNNHWLLDALPSCSTEFVSYVSLFTVTWDTVVRSQAKLIAHPCNGFRQLRGTSKDSFLWNQKLTVQGKIQARFFTSSHFNRNLIFANYLSLKSCGVPIYSFGATFPFTDSFGVTSPFSDSFGVIHPFADSFVTLLHSFIIQMNLSVNWFIG